MIAYDDDGSVGEKRVFYISFKVRFYGNEDPEDFMGFIMDRTDLEDDIYEIHTEEVFE